MFRRWPLESIALVAGLGLVVSCGGRSPGARDASGAPSGDGAEPPGDATADVVTAPSDPPAPSASCQQKAVALKDVCADPATCAVRKAVDLDCNGHTIGKLDLAVGPTGAAFVALALDTWGVVAVFEVDAPRHLEVDRPSYVRPIVHTSPAGGARVLMTGPVDGPNSIARPTNGDWVVEPLVGVGAVFDFMLADDGATTVLEGRVDDGGPPRLLLTDVASGAPGTVIAEGGGIEYAKVARARDGSPVVVYTQPGSSGLAVRRWQAGAVTELGNLPREHLGPPNPALRLASALAADDSTTAAFSADGGLFRLPAVPLLPAPAWRAPMCGLFMIVNAPNICPKGGRPTVDLGEQVIGHALAGGWLAAVTGSVQAGCDWGTGGGCFETLPCQCNERETVDVLTPRLRLRSLDGPSRETSIALSRGWNAASVAVATDAAGLVYAAAHDTPSRVRLFVVDPAKL